MLVFIVKVNKSCVNKLKKKRIEYKAIRIEPGKEIVVIRCKYKLNWIGQKSGQSL